MLNRLGAPHLIVSATLLVGGGLVMLYSASAPRGELLFETSLYYVGRQLGALALGLLALVLAMRMPLSWIARLGYVAWGVSVLAVAATFSPLGIEENGARRWLAVGGFVLQPLEAAKLGVVLALAQWFSHRDRRVADFRISVLAPALFAGVPAALLLAQPDFGGAFLIVLFAGIVAFVAGARLDHLTVTGLCALPAVAALAVLREYRMNRLESFWDPWLDPLGRGYQAVQSQIAFGAGGFTGAGLGAGQQKLGFLPEAHTDFVFSVIGEEIGLIGVAAVLICFCVWTLASLGIAARAQTRFGMLVATGAGALVWVQALLNVGVAVGALPTKGATLPFFSYGRMALIASLVSVGLILNVARPSKRGRSGWR